jgi:DNA primase
MSIDFQKIKESVSMADILTQYGIEGIRSDGSYVGKCPLHQGDNPTAFHANANVWHCFTGCSRGGSIIDFVARKEDLSIYEAAKKIEQWFLNGNRVFEQKDVKVTPSACKLPLDFELLLESNHPYLDQRKILSSTREYFGIGYCSQGIMKDRIAIPIHNENGELVAYAGRSIAPSQDKYRFPRGFLKSAALYNLHRALQVSVRGLIVVEGFFDVFRLDQAGFSNVVAIMGSSLSEKQEKLLAQHTCKVILMFDGDQAGQKGMREAALRLFDKVFVRTISLQESSAQPDLMEEKQLQNLLNGLLD